jgi:anti-sigma-K factor RskA
MHRLLLVAVIADLNATVATRYGIDPGDLQLKASAGVQPDLSKSLDLRAIQTDGMADHLGVFHAAPPASVQFRLGATRSGSHMEMTTTADIQLR